MESFGEGGRCSPALDDFPSESSVIDGVMAPMAVSLKGWFQGMLRVIVVVLGFGRQLTNARKPLFDGGCHFGDVLTVTDFGIWHYIAAMAVGVQFL